MEPLNRLYQEIIIDHSRQPHNYGTLPEPVWQLEGFNPLCGDRFIIYLDMDHDLVQNIRFSGQGCAISTASTSMMTDLVKGKRTADILRLVEQFQQLVTNGTGKTASPELGKASALAEVAEFPMRVKCATLSWHTLRKLLTSLDAEQQGNV